MAWREQRRSRYRVRSAAYPDTTPPSLAQSIALVVELGKVGTRLSPTITAVFVGVA